MTQTAMAAGMVPEWDLADRMRKALRSADLGVEEIAEYLGVNRNTVGRWINGKIVPSTQTMRLWALRTGVSYEWLADGVTPTAGLPRKDSNLQPAVLRRERRRERLPWLAPIITCGWPEPGLVAA